MGAEQVNRFYEQSAEAVLHNLYGPAEAAIEVTYRECEAGERVIPIGRPIANTQMYVLDGEMQERPVGVAGELYIGGAGVARGYVNRADLTAERFVPDRFGGGGRLYRTGDLARWRESGELEFLGRIDEQVKIRGFRVEPEEIAAVLRRHEKVSDAVVILREEQAGDARLVAYTVGEGEGPSGSELRSLLREHLPEYMVPSAFVRLRELPLTPNGKIDRRGLPKPEKWVGEEAGYRVPRNAKEEILAGIWGEVLGRERIGIEDNFFELGGHSLSAMQVVTRVREAFGEQVALRGLFERPTIRRFVEGMEGREQRQREPEIREVERDAELPLSYAQERLWFLDQLVPGNAFYNVPLAVRLEGELNEWALEAGLNEIVRRHEVLRTRFEVKEGVPRQVVVESYELAMPVTDLRDLGEGERDAEVRRIAKEEGEQAFDLGRGPLLRVRLLRVGEQERVLLLTMHHIVSDGWSMGVMVKEIAALYEAFSDKKPSPLRELPIQYSDYAVWQREWLTGNVLEQQLEYWKGQLAELAELKLPTDYERPAKPSYRGASERFELSEDLTRQLRELARREGVTLYMTLLAAFTVLLARYTGQDDIVLGTPVAKRPSSNPSN